MPPDTQSDLFQNLKVFNNATKVIKQKKTFPTFKILKVNDIQRFDRKDQEGG